MADCNHEGGGRCAIVAPDGTFTHEDLEQGSTRVAASLLSPGSRADLEGARVAFFVPPSFAHVAVQRGIWRAGGVAVPLALSHPPAELDYVIRDAGASCVIIDPACGGPLAPIAAAAGARLMTTGETLTGEVDVPMPDVARSRPAMIVYTSGTTGRPKGVVTTHGNIEAQVAALIEAWGWTAADYLLLVLPLHHVHGIINGFGSAIAARATCEMLHAFDAVTVWSRLASGDVTVFTAVPTIYHRLIAAWDAAPEDVRRRWSDGVGRLRLMMSGSAALPVQMLERWRAITGHTLLERYGMTEIGMALSNPLVGQRHPGHVGMPLPSVAVRVVDEAGDAVPDGETGELEVRGPGVFREYWQRPDETQAAFRDGWFRTGDVALLDPQGGGYKLLGRTSVDIIKTGGFKVSALEIEEILREHPSIAECAVVGIADPEWGERVSAAVELRSGAVLALEELQQWAKARLAPYKVPRALQPVPALPRNAMGKVVKPEVAKVFERDRS